MFNMYKQYDVVLVDFGENGIGSEYKKRRPAIIVQNNIGQEHSPTTIVLPLSSKIKNPGQVTHTVIRANNNNGLSVDSMVMGEAVRQISNQRIVKYIGRIINETCRQSIRRCYMANFG